MQASSRPLRSARSRPFEKRWGERTHAPENLLFCFVYKLNGNCQQPAPEDTHIGGFCFELRLRTL